MMMRLDPDVLDSRKHMDHQPRQQDLIGQRQRRRSQDRLHRMKSSNDRQNNNRIAAAALTTTSRDADRTITTPRSREAQNEESKRHGT